MTIISSDMRSGLISLSSVWLNYDVLGKLVVNENNLDVVTGAETMEEDMDETEEVEDNFLSPDVAPFAVVFKSWLVTIMPLINCHLAAGNAFLLALVNTRRRFDESKDDEYEDDSTPAFRQNLFNETLSRILESFVALMKQMYTSGCSSPIDTVSNYTQLRCAIVGTAC
jgi:hypothetical protein